MKQECGHRTQFTEQNEKTSCSIGQGQPCTLAPFERPASQASRILGRFSCSRNPNRSSLQHQIGLSLVAVQRLTRPPNLQHIVLSRGREGPVLIRAPRQISRTSRVSTMHKQQLGRSIFLIFRSLFEPNLGHVPQVDAAVARRGSENRLVVRRPRELENFFLVRLERVQFQFEVAHVPQRDRLVGRARNQNVFVVRRERDGVDFGFVRFNSCGRLDGSTGITSRVPAVQRNKMRVRLVSSAKGRFSAVVKLTASIDGRRLQRQTCSLASSAKRRPVVTKAAECHSGSLALVCSAHALTSTIAV